MIDGREGTKGGRDGKDGKASKKHEETRNKVREKQKEGDRYQTMTE